MEKTVFKNETFHVLLVVALSLFICWNLYTLVLVKNYFTIVPLLVQAIVLAFVLTRDKGAKMAIKVWSILLIIGPGLSILGKTIKIFFEEDIVSLIGPLFLQIVLLVIGLTIYHYNDTTVNVEIVEEGDKTTPPQP
ncbi:hypothetical protein [Flagellimonas meridianipacifica]|uniref:Uncharacterized protein n=1 Tax=Flagellimonas meridianipacifica TaxID=1080225 RepID=A0A2T0M868_9FLAO|nr:hypothetical protein [Allomuricauda pacifica]PRX53736.1 hypothetical protein CLV81_2123 [Allomuricauda pacifica]